MSSKYLIVPDVFVCQLKICYFDPSLITSVPVYEVMFVDLLLKLLSILVTFKKFVRWKLLTLLPSLSIPVCFTCTPSQYTFALVSYSGVKNNRGFRLMGILS